MPLWLAVLILLLAVIGMITAHQYLRKKRALYILCCIVFSGIAVLSAGYIGLTAIFIDAAKNKPPNL